MRLHPELEAYRDRLMERAAAWPGTAEADLVRDLQQCEAQIALLEKGVEALRTRLKDAPDSEAGAATSETMAPEAAEAIAHRASIQDQMRELTAAYAEVLRRHLEGRAS